MRFIPAKKGKYRSLRMHDDVRFKCFADYLCLSHLLQLSECFIAHFENLLPFSQQRRGSLGENLLRLGKERQMHTDFAALDLGQILPDLVCGEAEDGRDQADESVRDLSQD